MVQRKTQNPAYWREQFSVTSRDLDFISNKILEETRLLTLQEIALALIEFYIEAEEAKSRDDLDEGQVYQPKQSYAVGDKLLFLALNSAVGTVQATRAGTHPEYKEFTVLEVAFEPSGIVREFAADFSYPHNLNTDANTMASLQGLKSPEEIYKQSRRPIETKIRIALDKSDAFVTFNDEYFLRDLLTTFDDGAFNLEGIYNIADAAIDISKGPLPIDTLIEQMGLGQSGDISDVLRFSVNYWLSQDERFNNVGPTGQVRWYLRRLEPPEVRETPPRLRVVEDEYDADQFDEETLSLLATIDDEGTYPEDVPETDDDVDEIEVTLIYPHLEVGSLPLTPKTESFFPQHAAHPVHFEFVDGHTGDTFPGWAVASEQFVFGLKAWYQDNNLPVGAYVTLKRTDDPFQVVISYQKARARSDWIRVSTITGNRLTFQMSKEAYPCKYDELMVIGESAGPELAELWQKEGNRTMPLPQLMRQIFPELSKLNPQSTVHAKTIYSAVNIVRRVAPGVIFEQLQQHGSFVPMDHSYWTFDPTVEE